MGRIHDHRSECLSALRYEWVAGFALFHHSPQLLQPVGVPVSFLHHSETVYLRHATLMRRSFRYCLPTFGALKPLGFFRRFLKSSTSSIRNNRCLLFVRIARSVPLFSYSRTETGETFKNRATSPVVRYVIPLSMILDYLSDP